MKLCSIVLFFSLLGKWSQINGAYYWMCVFIQRTEVVKYCIATHVWTHITFSTIFNHTHACYLADICSWKSKIVYTGLLWPDCTTYGISNKVRWYATYCISDAGCRIQNHLFCLIVYLIVYLYYALLNSETFTIIE